jgi:cell division protein FtsN
MSTGAVAGIAIGGTVVIVLGVVAIMVVRSKLRKSNPPTEVMSPFQPKEPLSPTPAYTNSTVYPSTQQPEQVRHQGPVWEADSGLRIDTQQGWPAAQLRGP